MITLSFGRWHTCSGKRFYRKRIYRNGYKWTPFCKIVSRHGNMKKNLEQLIEIKDIQGQKGNFDVSEYQKGLYEGLDLAVGIMVGRGWME